MVSSLSRVYVLGDLHGMVQPIMLYYFILFITGLVLDVISAYHTRAITNGRVVRSGVFGFLLASMVMFAFATIIKSEDIVLSCLFWGMGQGLGTSIGVLLDSGNKE